MIKSICQVRIPSTAASQQERWHGRMDLFQGKLTELETVGINPIEWNYPVSAGGKFPSDSNPNKHKSRRPAG
jgi:hypothetical protein